MHDFLTQDEIDSLLSHMADNSGGVASSTRDEAQDYSFKAQGKISWRLPSFDQLNKLCAHALAKAISDWLPQAAEVLVLGTETQRQSDYLISLEPQSIGHMLSLKPLNGTGLVLLPPALLDMVMECYFGGIGTTTTGGRRATQLTALDLRVSELLGDCALAALRQAWEPVQRIDFVRQRLEVQNAMINVASANEVLVVSRFQIAIGVRQAELHVAIPYSVIEPLRERLGSYTDGARSEFGFAERLCDSVQDVTLEARCELAQIELSLRSLLKLAAGDVLPFTMPKTVMVSLENTPLLHATMGEDANNHPVIQVQRVLNAPNSHSL